MKKILFILIPLVAIFAVVESCKKKPLDDLDIIFNAGFSDATASFQFIDAKTLEQIGLEISGDVIDITIEGPDKDKVVNFLGGTDIESTQGFLSIALKEGTLVSEANPVKFHVVAHKDGYFSNSVAIVMTSPGTEHHVVAMVDYNNTPDGVAAVEDNSIDTDASGATTAPIVIETPVPVSQGQATIAKVSVPAGTILKDKDGVVVTGAVSTKMAYFNNVDETSRESFPGGFTADLGDSTVQFTTAGFVALEMTTAGGKEIKNFGSPIAMTMEIPAGSKDNNGNLIVAGSEMPIWSYNPNTGEWTSESTETVSTNGQGKLEVTFQMTHLSYWNMDFFGSTCFQGATLSITSNYTTNNYVKVKFYDGNDQLIKTSYKNIKTGQSQILNAPQNTSGRLEIFLPNGEVKNVPVANYCTGTININIATPAPPTIRVDVTAYCKTNKAAKVKPTVTVYARKEGTTAWIYAGEMVNGIISVQNFELNTQYEVLVYYKGTPYRPAGTYSADSPNITFEYEVPEC
jgi:hypothetical protein